MPQAAGTFGGVHGRLLPEGRLAGPMPWVISIMMFLTVLAAAAGLGLGGAAARLGSQIGNRLTVQIVQANPDTRQAETARAAAALPQLPGVAAVRRVPDAEVQRLLEPWVGSGGIEADIPIPSLIDVDLAAPSAQTLAAVRSRLAAIAPDARIDDNAAWLAPLAGLITALRWLAGGLVVLMVGATGATVVLAARASLNTHRGTIEILHLMGSTDVQVARLFQRRIGLDALFGGTVGFIAAALILILIGNRVAAIGSELLGSAALPTTSWLLLLLLPVAGVALSLLVARITILRALGRML